ncbi:MAG: hypothetical protein IT450_16260 [Phycisphaerales bacterium]|nr:hypothetical protein [Phycisphaerales bacterium]
MPDTLLATLTRIHRRLTLSAVLFYASCGLLLAAIAAALLGVNQLLTNRAAPPWVWGSLFAAGPLLGAIIGRVSRRDLKAAAAVADGRAHLKDRTVSALEFLSAHRDRPLEALQIEDAAAHLESVNPAAVAPIRTPRPLPYAAALSLVAAVLLLWPIEPPPVRAGPSPASENVVATADEIIERLEALQEKARENEDAELEKLAEELIDEAEAMKQDGTELKDALAAISEIQAALAAYQQQFNLSVVDAQLQALGEAMSLAAPLEAAGQALQKGDYDKAAEELEKLENANFDKKEAQTAAAKMKKVQAGMIEAGQGQLAEATGELIEGMCEGDNESLCKGGKKIAKAARGQGKKKKYGDYIVMQLDELGECKGKCSSKVKVKGKRPEKSTEPSSNWGLTTSGNTQGDKTSLKSTREEDEITGTAGEEGPTEIETVHSVEGRQQAQRAYAERYREYRKMSDAVLESEPIPLGHRSLIRRYFELIRPQNEETPEAAKGGKAD